MEGEGGGGAIVMHSGNNLKYAHKWCTKLQQKIYLWNFPLMLFAIIPICTFTGECFQVFPFLCWKQLARNH